MPAILAALADEKNDRALDHALTYALIEIGNAKGTAKGLTSASPRVRRACLAALENIPNSGLEAKSVLAELDAKDQTLRETAWWIAGRHPQWGGHLASYFKGKLMTADELKSEERDELATRLLKFTSNEAIQKVMGESLQDAKPVAVRFVLGVMTRSGLKALPPAWQIGLLVVARKIDDPETLRAVLGLLRVVPCDDKTYVRFIAEVPREKLWPGGHTPIDFRLAMLAAQPPGQPVDVGHVIKSLNRDEPAAIRSTALEAMARAKLSSSDLARLAGALRTANLLELPKLLDLFAKSTDEAVGLALVRALHYKPLLPVIRTEMVKPILDKFPKKVKDEAEALYAALAVARKAEVERLEKLLAELQAKPGDIRRGQLVFNNAKTQCIACHKVGYVGGLIGPDLTRIGGIRSERDLLEAIVFPSASFVRSYEPVRVLTTDERTFNGILKKDAPDEIIVVVAADKEERVARADVASITPSSVSLMPSGLDQQLTQQDLADLVAFLKACK
jgi:putative heme-binding domain-containing protein